MLHQLSTAIANFSIAAITANAFLQTVTISLWLILPLVVLVILDTATGIAAARKKGESIQSLKLGDATNKLLGYLSLHVVTIILAAIAAAIGLTWAAFLTILVVVYMIVRESWSILENVDIMGIDVPPALRRLLRAVDEAVDEKSSDKNDKTGV